MLKKLGIAAVILLVGAVAVKKLDINFEKIGRNIERWACKDRCKGGDNFKQTAGDIEKEIAKLDGDIRRLAGPLADLEFDIDLHKQEIAQLQGHLKNGKKVLNTWLDELDTGERAFKVGAIEYNREQFEAKVVAAGENYKRLQKRLDTKQKLLAAKQKRHNAIYQQVEKMATKKQEFQVRLENVRADNEARLARRLERQPVKENGRVHRIDKRLRQLEKQQWTDNKKDEILDRAPFNTGTPSERQAAQPNRNLQEVRQLLGREVSNGDAQTSKRSK
jgi:chromosome segregation ATPase